jgi:hypothetical protein
MSMSCVRAKRFKIEFLTSGEMKTHFENDEALQLALNAFGVQKTQECFPNAPPGREAFYFEQSAESVFAVTSCIIVGGVYCSR